MAIEVVDKCRCCQCWELTLLDENCDLYGSSQAKMYMYGHFDRVIGDILKIPTKNGDSCWEITAGPDNINCDPGTVQSERGVHVVNCVDNCPNIDPRPSLDCWEIDSCSGLGGKGTSTDLFALGHSVGDVINIGTVEEKDCWKIKGKIACPTEKWTVTPVEKFTSCLNCYKFVPDCQCKCGPNCEYEITSAESADVFNIKGANSYLGFQRHIFNSATSQQPEFIRNKPGHLLKLYTCNTGEGPVWRGEFERYILKTREQGLTTDQQKNLYCPGPMDGGEIDLESDFLVKTNVFEDGTTESDKVLVSIRKDCENGNWLIKFDAKKVNQGGEDDNYPDGWNKGYPTRAKSISEPFFIGYQVESPPESDTYYSKDQDGGTVLAGDRSDMCCGGEIKVERNCPRPEGTPRDQNFYLKGTIDIYADECECNKEVPVHYSTSASVSSDKVILDAPPP